MTTSITAFPSSPDVRECPPKGASAKDVDAFFGRFFDHKSPYREQRVVWGVLHKLLYESDQWLNGDLRDAGPQKAYFFTKQNQADEIPKPVQNEILPVVDNEVAKLGKHQGKARIRATAESARQGGAKKAQEILDWHLDTQVAWPRKRHKGIFHNVLYGLGVWKSYWDLDYLDTIDLGSTGAVKCISEECGAIYSSVSMDLSTKAPPGRIQIKEELRDGQLHPKATMASCLVCGGPFESYDLLPNEAQGEDAIGRPLSTPVPYGCAEIDVVHPLDMYFANEGIDQDPWSCCEFGQLTPRSLPWVAQHYGLSVKDGKYFTKDGEEVKPEDVTVILPHHPLLGDAPFSVAASSAAYNRDSRRNLYSNAVRVKEYYQLSSVLYPRGRALVKAGNAVVLDDDLMLPSRVKPKTFYPRVKYCLARFWPKDGEICGQSMVTPLVSPQLAINMAKAQVIDSRERYGTDTPLLTEGMRFLGPGHSENVSGNAAVYTPDPEYPDRTPDILPSRMIDGAVYQEIDRNVNYIKEAVGAHDADVGKAPRNVRAATGIQLLLTQAAERRDAREQELRNCFKELFSHQLVLLSEKVIEERSYEAHNEDDSWETKQFIGLDLARQTDVTIDEEASYDVKAYQQERLMELIQAQIIVPESAYAKREIARAMGLSMDYATEDNVQIDDADRKWFAFRDQEEVPAIDPTEDSHVLHWQTYGRYLKGPDGVRLKKEAQWGLILKTIAGWEQALQAAEMQDQMARSPQVQQSVRAGLIPQEQVEAMLLPGALEDRILQVWSQMIAAKGGQLSPHPLIAFKAVHEAHRLYAERKMAQAQVQPTLAAPDGGTTATGTAPTPGQPGVLAPGAPSETPQGGEG